MDRRITLVTLNYKEIENTAALIRAAGKSKLIAHIVAIDNDSNDGSYERMLEFSNPPFCTVLKSKNNGGYTKGFNQVIQYALENFNTEFIMIANADVIFDDVVLEKMMHSMDAQEDLGLVSPRMLGYDRKEEQCAWKYPTKKGLMCYNSYFWRRKHNINETYSIDNSDDVMVVDAVRSSLHFFRKCALEKCGGYDENIFLFNCENLISKELEQMGYKVGIITDAFYVHNHKPGTVNVMFRMKACLKDNLYFARKHLKVTREWIVIYKIFSMYGLTEMQLIMRLSAISKKVMKRVKK